MSKYIEARYGNRNVSIREHDLPFLLKLRKAWKESRLVLFLGAGVSSPYGLPSWRELVLSLLLEQDQERWREFYDNYRHPLASWMMDNFGFDPVSFARLIQYIQRKRWLRKEEEASLAQTVLVDQKLDAEFLNAIRAALYRSRRQPEPQDTALDAVVDLVRRTRQQGYRLPAIVTFNYDDLLEQKLRAAELHAEPIFDGRRQVSDSLPLIHPHGFLPTPPTLIPSQQLVFTEEQYHRLTLDGLNWAVVSLLSCLRQYTVLFVGLSMTDPNIRRLLDAAVSASAEPAHFQLRLDRRAPDATNGGTVLQQMREDISRRMTEDERNGVLKTPEQLDAVIAHMHELAHRYDRELFKDLGVRTIWYDKHEDVPAFLNFITSVDGPIAAFEGGLEV